MQKFGRKYVTVSLASKMTLVIFPLILISGVSGGPVTEMNRKVLGIINEDECIFCLKWWSVTAY
jgi:hypothetical protein